MYDREAAVRYADKWWDSRNPAFPVVRCRLYEFCFTMFACRWGTDAGLSKSWKGMVDPRGNVEFQLVGVTFAALVFSDFEKRIDGNTSFISQELGLGDVIGYDFEGDGRFDHSTIVTAKVAGVPLVNAHTFNVSIVIGHTKIRICSTECEVYFF